MIAATRMLLLSVALAGCTDSVSTHKAILEFGKACNTKVAAKFTVSQMNHSLELSCSDLGKRIEKKESE